MFILNDLLNRVTDVLNGLQGGEIPRLAVLPNEAEILDLQREQMAEGKGVDGEDLRPYYSEDLRQRGGWFLSGDSAARYAAWKQDIGNPYEAGGRNPDAPNLYINGKFYSEIGVQFGAEAAVIVPLTPFASEVMAKYGRQINLGMDGWMRIMRDYGGLDRVMEEIKRRLYGD
jgi:hypothetical protein